MRDRFSRVGVATVQDRRGRIYVGHTTVSGGMVTVVGYRRERPWHTPTGPVETRYPCSRSWPVGQIGRIDWTTDDSFELGSAA